MKTMSYPLLALTASLLLACGKAPEVPATPQAAAAAPVKLSQYTPEQFYATKSYLGNDINASGDAMLVASDETGVFNLYKVSVDGKNWQPLTQSTTDAIMPVSWFPQDDRVLYSADQGGNELDHLYVRELDGSVKDLTPGEKLKAMFVDWAADGSFYVLTNERDAKFLTCINMMAKAISAVWSTRMTPAMTWPVSARMAVISPRLSRAPMLTTMCI